MEASLPRTPLEDPNVKYGLEGGGLTLLGDDGEKVIGSEWAITYEREPLSPVGVSVMMRMRVVDGVPHCTELRFIAKAPEPGIRAKTVREFRLEDWIERACLPAAFRYDKNSQKWVQDFSGRTMLPSIRKARARARGGYTDELMREVAQIYEAHVGGHPTKAVREAFGIGQSTAQLYVKKARERGYITMDAPHGGRS